MISHKTKSVADIVDFVISLSERPTGLAFLRDYVDFRAASTYVRHQNVHLTGTGECKSAKNPHEINWLDLVLHVHVHVWIRMLSFTEVGLYVQKLS